MDDHGTVACIAPTGTQFHVNEGDGRRVPYIRTTGYTPIMGNPHQPMPTWAVRWETPPQVAGRPNCLGECKFRMAPGPKAYQAAGTLEPGTTPCSYGSAMLRPPCMKGTPRGMLCGDPQQWVSSCPLIPEDSRRAAALRKAAAGGYPPRAPVAGTRPAHGRRPQLRPVIAVEGEPPLAEIPEDFPLPDTGNEYGEGPEGGTPHVEPG